MEECICEKLPSIIEGTIKTIKKICFVEIEFIPKQWTTIYKCKCCNQIWKEIYQEKRHGEVPFLIKVSQLPNPSDCKKIISITTIDKLPPFATELDLKKCSKIVKKEAKLQGFYFDDSFLKTITISIMNTSYSIGGDYSPEIIKQITQNYLMKNNMGGEE